MKDKTAKIEQIDNAINTILEKMQQGVDVSEWSMDGITIKKRSPLEVIKELREMREMLSRPTLPRRITYTFTK